MYATRDIRDALLLAFEELSSYGAPHGAVGQPARRRRGAGRDPRPLHDPVQINGTTMPALGLLARVRGMQRAYSGLQHELVERVAAPGRLV